MYGKMVFALGVVALGACSSRAMAQDVSGDELQLEEIVVTAERRSTDLQDTAASVTSKSGDDMISQGRLALEDMLSDVAGVSGAPVPTDIRNPYADVTIRGVIANTPGNGTQIPSTAVYVDGVYEGIGGIYDVDRMEVLRGPQGTLYGRSATGGVISLYTRNPAVGEYEGYLSATAGSHAHRNYQAALNMPVGEQFAVRVSGLRNQEDGHLNAPRQQWAGRIKALYSPSESFSFLLGAATQTDENKTSSYSYAMTGPDTVTLVGSNAQVMTKDHINQYWAEMNVDIGDKVLTWLPAYKSNHTSPDNSYVGPPSGYVGFNPTTTLMDQTWTQELRLASRNNDAFNWIVGVFYYNNIWAESAYLRWLASGALAFSTDERKVLQDAGLFGETTLLLNDATRLTLGLRYDYNSSKHTQVYTSNLTGGAGGPTNPDFGLPEDLQSFVLDETAGLRTFRNVTYKARLERDLTPESMLYASVSSGYLPGDVQVSTDSQRRPYANPYDQTRLTAFELGSKNRFMDNRLQLNASVYYYDYKGYQVDVEPTPGVPGAAHITMTSDAKMYGGDMDVQFMLTAVDRVSLTAGVINAQFVGNPYVQIGSDTYYFRQAVAQRKFTGIAPETATLAYERTFATANAGDFNLRLDGQYSSAYDLAKINNLPGASLSVEEAMPYVHLGAQTLGNMSLNWSSPGGRLLVGGYVRNLTDNVHKTGVSVNYNGEVSGSPSEGRTVGVTLRTDF